MQRNTTSHSACAQEYNLLWTTCQHLRPGAVMPPCQMHWMTFVYALRYKTKKPEMKTTLPLMLVICRKLLNQIARLAGGSGNVLTSRQLFWQTSPSTTVVPTAVPFLCIITGGGAEAHEVLSLGRIRPSTQGAIHFTLSHLNWCRQRVCMEQVRHNTLTSHLFIPQRC